MSDNWVAVDFESAAVIDENGVKTLVVRGETTSSSATGSEVRLSPVDYFAQPEYWRIEVLWNRADAILTVMTPYQARLSLESRTGSKGIEVFGKEKSVKIDI
jgi:hypothetical protein